MKIGIDISAIIYGTGVSVYTRNLVENLLKLDDKNDYVLFFSSLRRSPPELLVRNYDLRNYKLPPTLLDILWNKFHIINLENFVGDVDVFHCSDWTQPPAKQAKLVTTIHDLSFLKYPNTAHPKVLKAQTRRLRWVEKEADAIIAVSQATKNEIIKLLKIPEKKIHVIYEALDNSVLKFKPKKNKINKPYFIAFGSQAPRKNISRIIKAFENLQLSNANLVITSEYKYTTKLPKNIITTGYIKRDELLSLIQNAEALVYPSLYEGFGLPILEAFHLKTPVITSNCSSMKEIAGDAAILVDPKSVKSISQAMKQVLSNDSNHRTLVKRGIERLKDFSWQKTAKKTLEVYESFG